MNEVEQRVESVIGEREWVGVGADRVLAREGCSAADGHTQPDADAERREAGQSSADHQKRIAHWKGQRVIRQAGRVAASLLTHPSRPP